VKVAYDTSIGTRLDCLLFCSNKAMSILARINQGFVCCLFDRVTVSTPPPRILPLEDEHEYGDEGECGSEVKKAAGVIVY